MKVKVIKEKNSKISYTILTDKIGKYSFMAEIYSDGSGCYTMNKKGKTVQCDSGKLEDWLDTTNKQAQELNQLASFLADAETEWYKPKYD